MCVGEEEGRETKKGHQGNVVVGEVGGGGRKPDLTLSPSAMSSSTSGSRAPSAVHAKGIELSSSPQLQLPIPDKTYMPFLHYNIPTAPHPVTHAIRIYQRISTTTSFNPRQCNIIALPHHTTPQPPSPFAITPPCTTTQHRHTIAEHNTSHDTSAPLPERKDCLPACICFPYSLAPGPALSYLLWCVSCIRLH